MNLFLEGFIKHKTLLSLDGRTMQWRGAEVLFSNSSLKEIMFGYGSIGRNMLGDITGFYASTHNFILEQILLYGLITAIISLVIIIIFIKKGIFNYRYESVVSIITCGLIAHLILLQTISSTFTIYFALYFLMIECGIYLYQGERC